MKTALKVGYTSNLNSTDNFGYAIPSISFTQKLNANGKLVLATKLKSHFTFGDGYEFYQAASIGGNDEGLRGYRNERFTGKNMFYHSSDIRFNIKEAKTSLIPLNMGIYGGFDYGKVWGGENLTINPFNQKDWNISYGGGIFFDAADIIGANLAAFHSDDGLRISFGLGFNF
jgi:hemolysin activation/secretion protein